MILAVRRSSQLLFTEFLLKNVDCNFTKNLLVTKKLKFLLKIFAISKRIKFDKTSGNFHNTLTQHCCSEIPETNIFLHNKRVL